MHQISWALPTRYYEYFDKNVLIILHLIEYTKLYKIDYLCLFAN